MRKFVPLLLVAVGLGVYGNSFQGVFVFDDLPAIVENHTLRNLFPLRKFLTDAPPGTVAGRPVVGFSFALSYAMWGLDPWGYHAINAAVHVLAALALYGIVRRTRLMLRRNELQETTAMWLGFVAALIWLVHPLQTEAVTYVVQRAESLMGLFYLLTIYCAIRGFQAVRPAIWHTLAVIACALGMGTKEIMATGPIAVLLYDWMFIGKNLRTIWRQRFWFYLGLLASWIVLATVLYNSPIPGEALKFPAATPMQYLRTEPGVILHYLRLAFWPNRLCLDYSWPIAKTMGDIVLPSLIVVGLLLAALWAVATRKPWGFPSLCFFLILAPTSSMIPLNDLAFEHRMYLPLATIVTLVVVGIYGVLNRMFQKSRVPLAIQQTVWCGFPLVVLLTLSVLTIRRNEVYRSARSIWQDTIAQRPLNARAYNNLANAIIQDHPNEALALYQKAVEVNPLYPVAHYNWALALAGIGESDKAASEYEAALSVNPSYPEAHYNLGLTLGKMGKLDQAVIHFREAVRLRPRFADAHFNLGYALAKQGKFQEAIPCYQAAIRLSPEAAKAHYNLGLAYERTGAIDDAVREVETALKLSPDSEPAFALLKTLRNEARQKRASP